MKVMTVVYCKQKKKGEEGGRFPIRDEEQFLQLAIEKFIAVRDNPDMTS